MSRIIKKSSCQNFLRNAISKNLLRLEKLSLPGIDMLSRIICVVSWTLTLFLALQRLSAVEASGKTTWLTEVDQLGTTRLRIISKASNLLSSTNKFLGSIPVPPSHPEASTHTEARIWGDFIVFIFIMPCRLGGNDTSNIVVLHRVHD